MYAFPAFHSAQTADDLTLERKPTPVFDNPELAHAERIACAACDVEVTQAIMRIAVGGRHRHTFPATGGVAGVAEEVGCYSLAPGCRVVGHFRLDYTGEDDGLWQTAFCATCGAHLGWHYQSSRDLGFFALILAQLKALP
ncbi:MAG: cereblon family protein [Solidesulfovibrio sp. DCME]|uniref:cereblon family protein n=1 Tax=Solidesulfovibrio sp. DCME TaxID=3447380 RepID=UPI003D0EC888